MKAPTVKAHQVSTPTKMEAGPTVKVLFGKFLNMEKISHSDCIILLTVKMSQKLKPSFWLRNRIWRPTRRVDAGIGARFTPRRPTTIGYLSDHGHGRPLHGFPHAVGQLCPSWSHDGFRPGFWSTEPYGSGYSTPATSWCPSRLVWYRPLKCCVCVCLQLQWNKQSFKKKKLPKRQKKLMITIIIILSRTFLSHIFYPCSLPLFFSSAISLHLVVVTLQVAPFFQHPACCPDPDLIMWTSVLPYLCRVWCFSLEFTTSSLPIRSFPSAVCFFCWSFLCVRDRELVFLFLYLFTRLDF